MRERLIAERISREWTQREVAKKLNISEIYVRKIEKGQRNPGRLMMLKFEMLYSVSERELFPDLFLVTIDT